MNEDSLKRLKEAYWKWFIQRKVDSNDPMYQFLMPGGDDLLFEPKVKVRLKPIVCVCKKCKMTNEYTESNQDDGSYVMNVVN